jgi:hypothetical protein
MATKDIKIDDSSLPIREFQLDWMVDNASICMIAKRGSGKSWVVRSILKYYRNIPGGIIIAPTDKMNSFYGKFFPDIYIHYEYKSEIIEKMLYRQTQIIEKAKEKARRGKKCDPRAFLIMDDCLSSKGSWMKDETIMQMFFDGRHYKIMYILTMQFPLGITPELRCNFDYIFLLAEDFQSNQKRLYDHYAGMFPSFPSFRQVFVDLTDDYGCMVIVNRGSRKNFLDKVFWYKAIDDNIDQIGCNQFNEFNKNNYDKHWREKNKPFDITQFVDSRRKDKINVAKIANDTDNNK